MVFIDTNLKDIPRKEIDALESLLNKLLKQSNRIEFFGKKRSDLKEEYKHFTQINLEYEQGAFKEAVKIEAEGVSRESNFEVKLKMNLPDETYSIIMQNLRQEAPILTKQLPKPSYSMS